MNYCSWSRLLPSPHLVLPRLILRMGCWAILIGTTFAAPYVRAQDTSLSDNTRYVQLKDSLRIMGRGRQAIEVRRNLGVFFMRQENLDSGQYYVNLSLALAEAHRDSLQMGKAKHILSYVNLMQADYLLAKENAQEAIDCHLTVGDSVSLYKSKISLGIAYRRLGLLSRSLRINLETAQYYRNEHQPERLLIPLNNLGLIYSTLDHYDKAEEYYQEVIAICDSLDHPEGALSSLQNLANIYLNRGEYKKAISHYNKIIEVARLLRHLTALEAAYNGIGYTHYAMKDYYAAIGYARRSMAVTHRTEHREADADNMHTIGMSYLALEDFDRAERYLRRAHDIATERNYLTNLVDFEEGLYLLYQQTGNFEKALAYHQDYIEARDRINGNAVLANVNEIEADFLTEEKERALIKLSRKKQLDEQRFKRTINYISLSLALVSILSIVLFQRQKVVLARKQQQLTQNKYESLRSQMNPHFIFNTINGVQNQILKADKLDAYQHLNRFADTIRLMLNNSKHSFVNLQEEITLIEHYIALEQVRFAHKFAYRLTVSDPLCELNPMIPSMILQPIIENAIIHGLSNKETTGCLTIRLEMKEKSVLCTIKDDGIGRKEAMRIKQHRVNKHLSIATENTQQRIQLLKRFGYKRSRIAIEDLYDDHGSAAGTRVYVEMPIKNMK